jgi:hypothetical protein
MKKFTEKIKGRLAKHKDDSQSLRPGTASHPSSRISTRAPSPMPTAESILPVGTEDSASTSRGKEAHEGPSGASRLLATTICDSFPDAIIAYIAGTIIASLPIPATPDPSSLSLSEIGPVPSPAIYRDSAPSGSVSSHSAKPVAAETFSTISSPPATAPIPSSHLSTDIALLPVTPALDNIAESIPDVPDAEQSGAKPVSKLEQWWLDHRKGVVSGVKTVLEVASKLLEDIPAGGSTAAMVLDFASKGLERVQVIFIRQ